MSLPNLINMVNQPWVMEEQPLNSLLKVFDSKLSSASDYEALVGLTQKNNASKQFSSAWDIETEVINDKTVSYIFVSGTLVPRTGGMSPYCGMTPVLGLGRVLQELDQTSDVIILHFDSPGGVITGIPETTKIISELSAETIAYTDTMMCSGAYWLASACDQIFASESAVVGSIGAYVAVTKKLQTEKSEYKTHIFSAGDKKVYGASVTEMTDQEMEHFQKSVTETRDWFIEDVARGRGKEKKMFEDTQAGTYKGKDTVGVLIDGTMSLDYLINNL